MKPLIFDGAMGTMLQAQGLPPGACPESWNTEQPEKILAVHQAYVAAGADIIETNTFGANAVKLRHYQRQQQVRQLNETGARLARQAAGPGVQVAGAVGPLGQFIAPLGELSFAAAQQAFREQIAALCAGGADIIVIETIIDIQEMRAALLAAKEVTDKPIFCHMSFNADGRTITGTDATTAAVILSALGADAVGANCSTGPAELLPVVQALAAASRVPVSVLPNAGLPELHHNQTVFPLTPAEMAKWAVRLAQAGATYIGGCCGTTPAHIAAIRQALEHAPAPTSRYRPATALTSRTKTVYLGHGCPPVLIGERINPTGRPQLQRQLAQGDMGAVKTEALNQVAAGADILDINMGVPGADETALLATAVRHIAMLTPAPLSIDTTDAAALAAALAIYPGKALVNSVTAEAKRLHTFLPVARKYGAAVLCLPLDEHGVPPTAAAKLAVARRIITAACQAGIPPEDILLDPLILTVAAAPQAARLALDTLSLYRREGRYATVMGLSNISYGLPQRPLLNSTFLAMALAQGIDAPIANPYDPALQDVWAAARLLLGHDQGAHNYIARCGAGKSQSEQAAPDSGDILNQLKTAVIQGDQDRALALLPAAIDKYGVTHVTEQALSAAMQETGRRYAQGILYLPQVMLAAETMRAAFTALEPYLGETKKDRRGTVVLATVQGDIHDLGKNIVAALLRNHGFTVVDLGKDVNPAKIVNAARQHHAHIVGLTALMTTTMPAMAATVAALRAARVPAYILVGGAVVTADYAREIGADGYAADAVAAVDKAQEALRDATTQQTDYTDTQT